MIRSAVRRKDTCEAESRGRLRKWPGNMTSFEDVVARNTVSRKTRARQVTRVGHQIVCDEHDPGAVIGTIIGVCLATLQKYFMNR